jgi:hypothetical protein
VAQSITAALCLALWFPLLPIHNSFYTKQSHEYLWNINHIIDMLFNLLNGFTPMQNKI